jgi:large subunit ribosomal protein L29
MEYAEIKKLTEKELHTNLKDERLQLKKLRFNHAVSSIENPNKIREAKKHIARLLTEINSRRKAKEVAQ